MIVTSGEIAHPRLTWPARLSGRLCDHLSEASAFPASRRRWGATESLEMRVGSHAGLLPPKAQEGSEIS